MTMTRMCPLKAMAPCWKEKCAWYLVRSKQCAIPLIANSLKTRRIFFEQKLFNEMHVKAHEAEK